MATAKTEAEAEIVFETAKDITLCKSQLVKVVALDPLCVSDRTGEATGLEDTSYTAFKGTVERSRHLYLGDTSLFTFEDETQRKGTTLYLDFDFITAGKPLIDGWNVVWSYYNGTDWVSYPAGGITDGTQGFSRNGRVDFTKIPNFSPHPWTDCPRCFSAAPFKAEQAGKTCL